jgi:hypothetical protein
MALEQPVEAACGSYSSDRLGDSPLHMLVRA